MTTPQLETAASDPAAYERIAQAIAFLRQQHPQQPDLKTVAQHVQLSESHFQQLLTRWAGLSPKRFSQYLTPAYAKAQLAATAGLSSPERLPALVVNLAAMSPGESKAGGAGWQIRYGTSETPFGRCLVAATARGICNLSFLDPAEQPEPALRERWPHATLERDRQLAAAIGDRLFAPLATGRAPLTLHVKGTNFQVQVWRALLSLPFAGLTTYRRLATTLGRPNAARAVGNAVGRNPVGYLIPCHRVIRESGALGGYRWGLDRKAAMLGWEASQQQNATGEA